MWTGHVVADAWSATSEHITDTPLVNQFSASLQVTAGLSEKYEMKYHLCKCPAAAQN